MQSILLVSDGDGTYSNALRQIDLYDITVWYHDPESELREKYPNHAIDVLKKSGVSQHFGMNLFDLDMAHLEHPFDCVQFNFPHVGNSVKSEDWISSNCALLKQYFNIAKAIATEVRVVLSVNRMFLYWDIDQCAQDFDLLPYGKFRFNESFWKDLGYGHQSNVGRHITNPLLKVMHVYRTEDFADDTDHKRNCALWSEFIISTQKIPMRCPSCDRFLASTLILLRQQYLKKQHIRSCGITDTIFNLIKNAEISLKKFEDSLTDDIEWIQRG